MAVTVERLVAILEARIDKFEKAMKRAERVSNSSFRRIERYGSRMEGRMAAIGGRIGARFAAALGAAITVRATKQLLDASVRIDNALKVAGLSGGELEKVFQRLRESALANGAPLEALVTLYGRAALVQKELGINSDQLATFVDHVAVALRVSGKSAQEASGALLQLSQALGSGVVRAEEFNSILEGAPTIAQAAAAGLEEAGGSVAKLRQLVIDGEISSQAFFHAFEAGSSILQEKVATSVLTLDQRLQNLQTELITAARKVNEVTGASETAGEAIDRLAEGVRILGDFFVRVANGPLGQFASKLGELEVTARSLIETWAEFTGTAGALRSIGNFIAPELPADPQTTAKQSRLLSEQEKLINKRIALAHLQQKVSIKDFPVGGTGGGAGGGGGHGGRGGGAPRLNDLEREIQLLQERTGIVQQMTAVQSQLNPLAEDYAVQLERARVEQELLAAAQRAGVEVTPELREQISELANAYAVAVDEADKLAEAHERLQETAEQLRDIARGALQGFIQDLLDGESAADALKNALSRVADQLLNIALTNLFSSTGGGGGGLLGSIFAGLFHSGGKVGSGGAGRQVSPAAFAGAQRMHSGGIAGLRSGEVPAILQRGELVIPKSGVQAITQGGGGGRPVNVAMTVITQDAGTFARSQNQIAAQTRSTFQRVGRTA